ncbi:MAG TPA: type VI secretion system tube protein Hcp [Chthonomonadaceae bacterium]|nr:type VI secretion system tube protein Hcp [Chthonomonadaceae bacterium]
MPTAVEFFLKLDGIMGESTDSKHKGEIQVLSFSFGVGQVGNNQNGGGGGAGKAQFSDLVVVKPLDTASPSLMLACSKGTHMHKCEFMVVPVNEDGVAAGRGEMALYQFSDVTIDAVRQMGNENAGVPTEEIAINFGRLENFQVTVGDGSV